MTYEEALQIAMEELYDAVEDLRYNNKGYEARIEKMCNRLLTARNVLCKALEDMQEKREWVGLEGFEVADLAYEFVMYDEECNEPWFDRRGFAEAIEAKLKERNT